MKKIATFLNSQKRPQIDQEAYLNRIKIGKESPTLSYLKRLHKAHLLQIPFENLDIHYGQKIILDYQKIFSKVVERGRGGFCYELNGLFYQLLLSLDFKCHLIAGNVRNKETNTFGKDFDHMIILVFDQNDSWLVDVGFGDGFIEPKKVNTKAVQMDYTKYWRFSQDPDEKYLLQVSNDASHFETIYHFDLVPRQMIEFMGMCEYHQTSKDSYFTSDKIITKLTVDGRVSLTGKKLKINSFSETSESDILNEDEFLSKLENHFDISYQQLIPKL